MTSLASALRTDIIARARVWVQDEGFEESSYASSGGVTLFEPYDSANGTRHGNFEDSSYAEILANASWRTRLRKPHPQRRHLPQSKRPTAFETDSCTSSDAVLMSVIAHPTMAAQLRSITGCDGEPDFGFKPRLQLDRERRGDRTEIDLVLRTAESVGLIAEAKLTESNFTSRPYEHVARYAALELVFDVDSLPRTRRGHIDNYQLIRNILAAQMYDSQFVLLHDARRSDLVDRLHETVPHIRDVALRQRCGAITWQELSATAPAHLRRFLSMKYGIDPT